MKNIRQDPDRYLVRGSRRKIYTDPCRSRVLPLRGREFKTVEVWNIPQWMYTILISIICLLERVVDPDPQLFATSDPDP
jgi:hypothetical protein